MDITIAVQRTLDILNKVPSDRRGTNVFYCKGKMCPVYAIASYLEPQTFIKDAQFDSDGNVDSMLTIQAHNMVENVFGLSSDQIISDVDNHGWDYLIGEMELYPYSFRLNAGLPDDWEDEYEDDEDWEF